ncbi:MAG: fatty acid desaturase family protein [Flavobacteriales bacterium]|nr:fatty acid desaturase family protein [Flavobacteriales bacterium]MCB9192153.1 fatty acid desaturase family protein [Flavobacteriales bacterium]MCB9203836.1 fatty acid desaturase family protein [Flavobacteriales bacterium]
MSFNAKDYLSGDEIKSLLERSDWKAAFEIAHTWFWISVAFALAGFFPNPFTIVVSLFMLGGKQLACAIIMHDTSHYAQFKSKNANLIFGNLFGGYPVFFGVEQYRPYHLAHHTHTGEDTDPDLNLTNGYPAGTKSLVRKVLRDLVGLTGIKILYALIMIQSGLWKFNLGGKVEWIPKEERKGIGHIVIFFKNMAGPLVVNLLMWVILWSTGNGWLYLLWIGAYFTTYQFCLRIRSIAEHSVVPDRHDNQRNTRTTYANFIERMLFAPHHVNYHAEHHLLMTVPSYNLPKMHHLLKQRGYFDNGLLEPNYLQIIRLAA